RAVGRDASKQNGTALRSGSAARGEVPENEIERQQHHHALVEPLAREAWDCTPSAEGLDPGCVHTPHEVVAHRAARVEQVLAQGQAEGTVHPSVYRNR